MPQHDVTVALRQMLTYAHEAMEMVRQATRVTIEEDIVTQRALLHTLEMIGEAATRVPAGDRACYPGIPWQDIVDLRNRLIHGYDRVDLDTVWEIAKRDLPALVAELERAVSPN